jgi:hypothetical protein
MKKEACQSASERTQALQMERLRSSFVGEHRQGGGTEPAKTGCILRVSRTRRRKETVWGAERNSTGTTTTMRRVPSTMTSILKP